MTWFKNFFCQKGKSRQHKPFNCIGIKVEEYFFSFYLGHPFKAATIPIFWDLQSFVYSPLKSSQVHSSLISSGKLSKWKARQLTLIIRNWSLNRGEKPSLQKPFCSCFEYKFSLTCLTHIGWGGLCKVTLVQSRHKYVTTKMFVCFMLILIPFNQWHRCYQNLVLRSFTIFWGCHKI